MNFYSGATTLPKTQNDAAACDPLQATCYTTNHTTNNISNTNDAVQPTASFFLLSGPYAVNGDENTANMECVQANEELLHELFQLNEMNTTATIMQKKDQENQTAIVGQLKKFGSAALLFIMALLFTSLSFSQGSQTFNASGTFTVPAGVTSITVQAWGGGGAGGGSSDAPSGEARGGAGGGGGAYASAVLTVTPGSNLSIVVGVQVNGVLAGNGPNGNASTITGFTAQIFAAAGSGGGAATNANGAPTGGAGGTVAASVGTTRIAGANGGNGSTAYGITSGPGGDGANGGGVGGTGIPTVGNTQNGNPGAQPGGGGSGSRTSVLNQTPMTGGAGAAGRVIISWSASCPTITATATKNDLSCFQNGTGQIVVTGSGGTAPYTYSINNGANYQVSNTFSGLSAGTYSIRVKDANGCQSNAVQ